MSRKFALLRTSNKTGERTIELMEGQPHRENIQLERYDEHCKRHGEPSVLVACYDSYMANSAYIQYVSWHIDDDQTSKQTLSAWANGEHNTFNGYFDQWFLAQSNLKFGQDPATTTTTTTNDQFHPPAIIEIFGVASSQKAWNLVCEGHKLELYNLGQTSRIQHYITYPNGQICLVLWHKGMQYFLSSHIHLDAKLKDLDMMFKSWRVR